MRSEIELATLIYANRGEATQVPYQKVAIGDWSPSQADCHNNVDTWVEHQRSHQAVRGWLIGEHGGWYRFVAHSVVEMENSRLIDITPSDPPMPFLRHPGSDAEFLSITKQTPYIQYPPSTSYELIIPLQDNCPHTNMPFLNRHRVPARIHQ